jgi:hypothetical protein
MNDIKSGVIDRDRVGFVQIPEQTAARFRLNAGDILFPRVGSRETLKRSYLVKPADVENTVCYADFFRIVPDQSKISPEYLLQCLQSPEFIEQIFEFGLRDNEAAFYMSRLGEQKIPIPSVQASSAVHFLNRDSHD